MSNEWKAVKDGILDAGKVGNFNALPVEKFLTQADLIKMREFVDKKIIKTVDWQWNTIHELEKVSYAKADIDAVKTFWDSYQQRPQPTPEEENRILRENCERYERKIRKLELDVDTKMALIGRHVLFTPDQADAIKELVATCRQLIDDTPELPTESLKQEFDDFNNLVAKVESRLDTSQSEATVIHKLEDVCAENRTGR